MLRVLHIHHALYAPHLCVRGLRKLGHKAATVYFDFGPPSSDLTWGCDYNLRDRWWAVPQHLAFFLYALTQFDIFHFWARPYLIPVFFKTLQRHIPIDLFLIKKSKKRIVFHADGCLTMVRPSIWKKEIDAEVCHVCQTTQGDTYGFCSNDNTIRLNRAMEQFADLRIGMGFDADFEAGAPYLFLPVDLDLWHPGLVIPPQFKYRRKTNSTILIYHGVGSHVIGNRGNIKGTVWVREAIENLQNEGLEVELMVIENCPNKELRFYQAQADIVVDQLLIGGGGQNARECLALGKPVLTRLHDNQLELYAKCVHPDLPPPFIATDRHNLKENLIRLIKDKELREEIGKKGLEFARNVLRPEACAQRLVQLYSQMEG